MTNIDELTKEAFQVKSVNDACVIQLRLIFEQQQHCFNEIN